jgi:hypothetical protein
VEGLVLGLVGLEAGKPGFERTNLSNGLARPNVDHMTRESAGNATADQCVRGRLNIQHITDLRC